MKNLIKKLLQLELSALSKCVYRRFRPYVIAVTGSSGKTTTKYMVASLLEDLGKDVDFSHGNLNTEIGLPMAILGYKKSPENFLDFLFVFLFSPWKAFFTKSYAKYLVLEYAADKPGDMRTLIEIVKPDISIITNIGVAHIGAFKTVEKIAQEKWILAQNTNEFVVCDDDVLKRTRDFNQPKAEVVKVDNIETVSAKNIKAQTNKTIFDLYLNGKKYETEFKFLGDQNIKDLELAVIAVHLATGHTKEIILHIKNLEPQQGRGRRIVGKKDILILDESYNANPLSMLAALKVLEKTKYGRKVAILGQMAEIEPIGEKSHKEIADYSMRVADLTIGLGDGFKPTKLDKWYPNVEELEKDIDKILNVGDTVLIKGSFYANRLDKLVEKLK